MSFKKLLGAALWKGLLLAMLLLLLLLAAASLMLQRGLLPESAAPAMVAASYAISAFIGGRQAVRSGEAGALPQALAVAACLYAAVWLVALGGGDIAFSAHGPLLTAGILGGGLAAGLPGRKKGRRQLPRHQAGGRPRGAAGRKRR